MRIVFVCDTPYQVLTATNLYWSTFYNQVKTADLYIVDQFRDAKTLYENMKKEKLFHNIYFLSREENRFMQSGLKRYIKVAYSYLNPLTAIKNQSGEINPNELKNKYDKIFSSVMTCFVSALIQLNKNAEFSLYDDGLGSYTGNNVHSGGGFFYRLFSWITKTGAYAKQAKYLYVNNKEMCKSSAAEEICQIPKMTPAYIEIANRIFGVQESENSLRRIMLLAQPTNGLKAFADDMDTLVSVLEAYKMDVMVRTHPRETEFDRYKGFYIEKANDLWELKIAQIEIEQLILIGTYSTAQITPKMLFDKEPYLVFLYHMSKAYTAEEKEMFDVIINDVKSNYRDPKKINIIKSNEELNELLQLWLR